MRRQFLAVFGIVSFGCGPMVAGPDASVDDAGTSLDAGLPVDDAGTDGGSNRDAGLPGPQDDAGTDAGAFDGGGDAGADAGLDGGGADAGAPDAGTPRCAPSPSVATDVYYVAINEPGASNTACDGRAPSDEGNGRCPFRDFESIRTRYLLLNTSSVRVVVRGGTYVLGPPAGTDAGLTGATGLVVFGLGTTPQQRVELVGAPGEVAILDGSNMLREVVRTGGEYVLVENLTIQNAGAHNIEVRGGQHQLLRCNRLGPNFASDDLKGDGWAADVTVTKNEFFGWGSQAIDMTEINDWLVEDNDFHTPQTGGQRGGGVGTKKGARDVTVRGNRFHDTAFGVGSGTGSPHPEPYEALRITWEGNDFVNLTGPALKVYSCAHCTFRNNSVSGALALLRASNAAEDGPSGCFDAGMACEPTHDFTLVGNRVRNTSVMVPSLMNAMKASELAGFDAGSNLYCGTDGGSPQFYVENALMDFAAWKIATGTDQTSTATDGTGPECQW